MDGKKKERGPRLNLIKATMLGIGSGGLNNKNYVTSDQLKMMCDELLKALPNTQGLRVQIRTLNYLKDDHTKARWRHFVEKQKEKKDEEVGDSVAQVNNSNKENKEKQNNLDGGSST